MVEKTVEDSVIILDSTKSERSMFDGDGARLTHKSAMKSTKENKQTKQKKSVKLTSPEFTPRNKKLPPLAVRKTPLLKTVFNGDNSILASNRAGKYPLYVSLFSRNYIYVKRAKRMWRDDDVIWQLIKLWFC